MKTSYDFSDAKRGPVIGGSNKTRITIHIDTEVLDAFRTRASAEGKGYQTLINDALRQVVCSSEPLTIEAVRKVIREELKAA